MKDAWKYNTLSDSEIPMIRQYIRTRPDLLEAARAEAEGRGYKPINEADVFSPENIFGKIVLQKMVPFAEFKAWTKEMRRIAG